MRAPAGLGSRALVWGWGSQAERSGCPEPEILKPLGRWWEGGLLIEDTCIPVPALLLTGRETLGKLLKFSVPQFPHLQNGCDANQLY